MRKKLLKALWIGAGAILGLLVVAMLAVNMYVQSAGTQKRIEHALSSGLRVPVRVTNTIVTPWGGLNASGITVPQAETEPGDFLHATDLHASFDWLPLLRRRLVVSEVSLDEPKITWFQGKGGRWRLPSEGAAKPAGAQAPKGPHAAVRPWEISVHRFAASNASFDFLNDQGALLLELSGVDFDCVNPTAAGTEGHASARNVSLRNRLFLRELHTNWSFQKGTLHLSSFETEIGGGEFRGDAQMATQQRYSPFTIDANFDRVDVNQLLHDAGQPPDEINGMLKGWVDLYGNPGKSSSINGGAHLELTGGHMQNFELFRMLGQALQIPDLVRLDLKAAEADMRVVAGETQVDRLILQSQNLKLDGRGSIESNGKLALRARLTVDPAISERLPSFILQYFETGEAGTHSVQFDVTNYVWNPKTDLPERILGHRIKDQVSDLLQSLFGKKKRLPAPSPTPAGEP